MNELILGQNNNPGPPSEKFDEVTKKNSLQLEELLKSIDWTVSKTEPITLDTARYWRDYTTLSSGIYPCSGVLFR